MWIMYSAISHLSIFMAVCMIETQLGTADMLLKTIDRQWGTSGHKVRKLYTIGHQAQL